MKNFSINLWSKSGLNLLASLACILGVITLNGCGGSGAGAAGAGATSTGITTSVDAFSLKAKSVTVLSSQPNLPSDGKINATLTIIVKDEGNRALENATVDLSTTDTGSVIQYDSKKTGADGTIKATLISTGKSNRVVPVVATVGSTTVTFNLPITGTSLTLSGPAAITLDKTGEYSLSLRDSSGAAFGNVPITVTSTAGNSFSPTVITTDANGQAKFTVNALKSGADTISIAAAGASSALSVNIASAQLQMTNVIANEEVLVGQSKTVSLLLTDGGIPQPNKAISLSSTRGSTVPASGTVQTNGSGVATFSISSATAGIGTLNVAGPGGTSASANVEFVSKTPFAVSLQPSKAIVASNPLGSSGNTSQLLATVRDATGNPVKGVQVNFSADLDPSNGSIVPGFALTDSAGVASVAFVAGASSSGPNGVKLKANVAVAPTITANSLLTVTSGGISIRIGTGNLLTSEADVRYKFAWTALVVDSAGKPIAGAPISIQVVPLEYYKGVWEKLPSATEPLWGRANGYITCASEDGIADPVTGVTDPTLLDGRLQLSEDVNGNGTLQPGNVASSSFVNVTSLTDDAGFSDFTINWPKSFSLWAKIRIDVKTQVKGSEASVSESFLLPILIGDAKLPSPPATYNSNGIPTGAFGSAGTCNNPN
jgi:Bacterial Ig-like domain (group 1)